MALGILGAYGGLTVKSVDEYVLVGELSLDGGIRPVRGVLPIAVATRAEQDQEPDGSGSQCQRSCGGQRESAYIR